MIKSLPLAWERMPFKAVAEVVTGKTPSTKVAEYFGLEVPFVTPPDLDKDEPIFETGAYLTSLGASQVKNVPQGSVLVCCIGSLGKVGFAGKTLVTNQQINSIVFDESKVVPRYGYHYCRLLKPILEKMAPATTVKIVNKGNFQELEIPLPPLSEQRRIAAILDKADAIRRKRQQAIRLTEEFLRSVFLDMFGDPVTNPKGWEVKKLQEISTKILSGTTPKGGKQVYVEEGIVFFRSQNIWRNRIDLDDVAYIDDETHQKMKKSSLKNKDILMTKTGRINTENSSLGRAAMFVGEDDSANINGHVYLIRLKKVIIHEYVLYILTTDYYRDYIRSVCVGGIDKRQINKEHLEKFPIISPPLELQQGFATIVDLVERQKSKLNEQLAESTKLFASLQQQAFRGEI